MRGSVTKSWRAGNQIVREGRFAAAGRMVLLFSGAFGTIRSNVELFVFDSCERFRHYTTACNGIFVAARHHSCRAPHIGRRRPWLDARRDGRDAFLARHRISVAGIFDGHSHGGFPEFVDTYRFRNRRTSVWFSCRPHWQNPCVNGLDSCVLDFKRGLRVHAHHSAAGLLSVCARTRDGRRVDDGGGADRGNLARGTSRQSARLDAVRLRDRRSDRSLGCGDCASSFWLARRFPCRSSTGNCRSLDPSQCSRIRIVEATSREIATRKAQLAPSR